MSFTPEEVTGLLESENEKLLKRNAKLVDLLEEAGEALEFTPDLPIRRALRGRIRAAIEGNET